LCFAWAAALVLVAHAPAHAAPSDKWLPIDPADLAMKSEPLAPGAAGIFLYREIVDDDEHGYFDSYIRIKILTEEGKKLGNIRVNYDGTFQEVAFIQGRTIHPDGTIIPWEGKALDETFLRGQDLREFEKAFTLPDVQVGSIIEYRFRIIWNRNTMVRTTLPVTADLFTRQLHFTLNPYIGTYVLVWQTQRVPFAQPLSEGRDGLMHFDAQNVPGLEAENFTPPKDAIEGKMDFYYTENQTADPNKFWKKTGKNWNDGLENFVGHNSAVRDEADKVAPAADPPETRLRKLYARAQQIRNLTHELQKTPEEIKAENLKVNTTAEDVLKNGYAHSPEINMFFIGLARAAGFEASSVKISNRGDFFFNAIILDPRQMNGDVVLAKLNGQDLFLDPANPHCAFGQLPWEETGVPGLKLDSQGGSFVTTTAPKSSDAVIERTANLQMGDDDSLQGKLEVTFSGQDALDLRQTADHQDDADRKKSLTDKVTAWLPAGATLTLTNQPDWAGSDSPLRAEFDVKTRPVATLSGHHVLMPESFFADTTLPKFEHPLRTYPIYFDHPWEIRDDITLALPATLEAANLPAPIDRSTAYGAYQLSCTAQAGALHCRRLVTLSGIYFDIQYYGELRSFFDEARNADQQQLMLQVAGTRGAKAHQ
jgi:hypothetical protein